MHRRKRLLYNTISSLFCQVVTIICGFILPRFILQGYGSRVNGLVASITQFLGIISFLEMGVGAVIQSSLYGPLARKNEAEVSAIIASGTKFFRKLAGILFVYVCILIVIYPFIANDGFGWLYTATLIAAMSISFFVQYYYGLIDGLLLNSDQRGYVQYSAQIVTIILNTSACCFLIERGASIQIVKLTTALIYLFRPIVQRYYIAKHYQIDRKIKYEGEPIKQKWNGVAQHIAAVVLGSTDSIVLTAFSTLKFVSIYSVYQFVLNGVKQVTISLTNGLQPILGELYAKNERMELKKYFFWTEWVIHTGTTFIFGCTLVLIVPFVRVYTFGINDANYIQPLFAVIMSIAISMICYRLPYLGMILAAGRYRQTQSIFIIGAIVNVVISVIVVKGFGLVGVAVGTLVALVYQTIALARYVSKHIIHWPVKNIIKQAFTDVIGFVLIAISSRFFYLIAETYTAWLLLAVETGFCAMLIMIITNLLMYPEMVKKAISSIKMKINRKNDI